ncbi:hypothetical protein OAG36_01135 [bacterium]|nr:hypothetical protein [bacterium]
MEKKDLMKAVLGAMMAGPQVQDRMKKKKNSGDEPEEREGTLIIIGEAEEDDDKDDMLSRMKAKSRKKA